MTSDRLRLAAQAMRREESPFLDAVANLLELMADVPCDCGLAAGDGHCEHSAAEAAADAWLDDPGDLPAAITGGAQ